MSGYPRAPAKPFPLMSWLCLLSVAAVTSVAFWPRPVFISQWAAVLALGACAHWSHYLSGVVLLAGRSFLAIPFASLIVIQIVNILFSFRPMETLEEGLRIVAGIGVAVLVVQHVHTPRSLRKAVLLGGIVSVIIALHALGQYLGFDVFLWWVWESQFGGRRPAGLLGNPILLGGHFAILLPAGLAGIAFGGTPARKIAAGAFAYLAAMLVLVSQSRAAWLAAAGGSAWLAWSLFRQFRASSARRIASLAVWALLAAAGIVGVVLTDQVYADRVFLSRDKFLSQFANRIAALNATALILRQRPLLGIGGGCFHHGFAEHLARNMRTIRRMNYSGIAGKTNPHCEYARILGEYGILGFGLVVWLAACCVKVMRSNNSGRRNCVDSALVACGVAYGINALFNMATYSAITSVLFWCGLGLLASRQMAVKRGATTIGAGRAHERRPGNRPLYSVAFITIGCLLALGFLLRPLIGAVYMRQGWGHMLDRDFENAYRSYSRAKGINWSYARESYYMGLASVELGDFRGSLRFFDDEILRNPYYHDTFDTYSAVLGMLGRPADAESYARRALSLNPMSLQGHINLGVALMRQGRQKEAADIFRAALRIDPDSADAIKGLAASKPRP